jgi:hypothetical protein
VTPAWPKVQWFHGCVGVAGPHSVFAGEPASGGGVAFYLVERYVPSLTDRDLATALARVDELPAGPVRHLWTVLILGEDTCLSVFEAPDLTAVEAANTRAAFHFDRVVQVTTVGTNIDDARLR